VGDEAFGAYAVAEEQVAAFRYVRFYLFPGSMIVADFLAVAADGEQTAQ
jgi:hypothetical protein